VSRDDKTSFPVHDLLKLVGLHVWCGLAKQSWAGIEAAGIKYVALRNTLFIYLIRSEKKHIEQSNTVYSVSRTARLIDKHSQLP